MSSIRLFSICKKKYNLNSSGIKIGIVDNAFNEDYSINYEDIITLINLLKNSDLKIKFILQSKRGYLEKEFNRLNYKNFDSGIKGDFSKLDISDFIISIGWQSTALKAASIFKKPFFFYSRNEFPYEENIFSSKKNKNLTIRNYCRKLWFNENNLIHKINKLFKDQNEFFKFNR